MACFLMIIVFKLSNKGVVGQLLNGVGKLLQGLTNELGPCFQVKAVVWGQGIAPIATFIAPEISLYVASIGTQCRTLAACPCRIASRCMDFSQGIQLLCPTMASNWQGNATQDVDSSNLGGWFLCSCNIRASTSASLVLSPCCMASTSILIVCSLNLENELLTEVMGPLVDRCPHPF